VRDPNELPAAPDTEPQFIFDLLDDEDNEEGRFEDDE
jgi:hypothetical protein